ncbi:MAG TPA: APC family permease, partial [Candidatus Eisenbacteria bacterium]|nr:APC family permease [Candidatus Eisenbacteria bacterium]
MPNVLKRLLVGRPLKTAQTIEERLTKKAALAIFSSDALSSVAYATDEILLVLVAAGTVGLGYSLPVALAIVVLMLVVVISYGQTIKAYPSGGGAYIVAKENLGRGAGLVAGASLLIDYILTVAVSITAGVAAITSAFPSLYADRVEIAVGILALVTLVNLRGIRESGRVFAVPTYVFIVSIGALIVVGLWRAMTGSLPYAPPVLGNPDIWVITPLLLMRAFAAGCTALTGIEAISNGVQAFRKPESKNARVTLAIMGTLLAVMFIGITALAHRLGVAPVDHETVLSQLARSVFGRGGMYFLIQVATAVILLLAANTSFADFPRLASIMAKDRFLPVQLVNLRGIRESGRVFAVPTYVFIVSIGALIVVG